MASLVAMPVEISRAPTIASILLKRTARTISQVLLPTIFNYFLQVPLRVDGLSTITKAAIDEGASPVLQASHEREGPHLHLFRFFGRRRARCAQIPPRARPFSPSTHARSLDRSMGSLVHFFL